MNDFYEDEAVWCLVRKATGRGGDNCFTLASAHRIDAEDARFFVARWDVTHLMWIHAPEPPATVMVEMTVEDVEWLADMDRDLNDDVRRFAVACRKALDAREAT